MEIEYLQEFVTLARLENYFDAAEELFISQSTLSKHIKRIEEELNVPLFDRSSRKIHLTRYGKDFLPYAQQITTVAAQARGSLSLLSNNLNNSVNLSVLPAFLAYGFQNAIAAFQQQFPDYPLHIFEGTNDKALQYLLDGTCNLAFVRISEEIGPDFAILPFVEDHLIVAVPIGHPLDDGRASVSIEELSHYPLMSSTSPNQERTLQRLSEESDVKLNFVAKLSRSDTMIEMMHKGFGCAILQEYPTKYYYGDKVVRIPIKPLTSNTIALVYMKNRPLPLAVRQFIRITFPEGVPMTVDGN